MKKAPAKKALAAVCAASLIAVSVSGCSSSSASSSGSSSSAESSGSSSASSASSTTEKASLSVSTNAVGDQATVLKQIAQDFQKENPNITVNFTAPGADYENMMKVKMASNQMPDVFATHGWAKARYGNFLMDLKDQSWASDISTNMKQFVTDSTGKVYVLPMDADVTGINYNVDILKKYNISVPSTWDEFVAACDAIRAKSNGDITPIHIGGGDSWTQGQYFDFFAIPAFEQDASYKR